MVIMKVHLTMQSSLTALKLDTFQKKFYKVIEDNNIITNIYRIQAYNSIMYGYFCIEFKNFMLKYFR